MANMAQPTNAKEIVDVGAIVRSNFVSRTSTLSSKYSSRLSDFKAKLEERKVDLFSSNIEAEPLTNQPMSFVEGTNPLLGSVPGDESLSSCSGSEAGSEPANIEDMKEVIDLLWPPRKRAKLESGTEEGVGQEDDEELPSLDPELLSPPKKDDVLKTSSDATPVCPFKKVFQQACGQCSSPAKYRCPRCGQFTCSLVCCVSHKRAMRCNGRKRKPGQEYVSKNDLTVNTVLSDIRFLNHVQRFYRGVERRDLTKYTRKRCLRNVNLRMMHAAKERGTYLRFLPEYMERSRRNTSKYLYATDNFLWHVELVFGLSRKPCNRIPEKVTLNQLLDSVWLQQFEHEGIRLTTKPYFKRRSDLRFLLEIPLCSSTLGGGFLEVSAEDSLRDTLSGFIVLEFPIIHVVLVEDLPKYNCVSRDALSSNPELLSKLDELHGFDSSTQAVQRNRGRHRGFKRRRPFDGEKEFKQEGDRNVKEDLPGIAKDGTNIHQLPGIAKDGTNIQQLPDNARNEIITQDLPKHTGHVGILEQELPRITENGRIIEQELPKNAGDGIVKPELTGHGETHQPGGVILRGEIQRESSMMAGLANTKESDPLKSEVLHKMR